MLKTITFLLALCCLSTAWGQIYYKSDNIQVLDNWDNDTIPTHSFGTFNDIWGYVADGSEYIIMGSARHIHFFDVTDPTNIVEVDRFEGDGNTVWRDFKTYGQYAYATSDALLEGVLVFDLSTLPDSVSLVYRDQQNVGPAHNCFIDEANGRLYVVGLSANSSIATYDLTQSPESPVFLGYANLDIYIHDIYVRDNIAYCSAGFDGFYIYDMTDATEPTYLASLPTNGYNHSSWLTEDGRYALFAEEVPLGLPLGIMNIQNMTDNDIQVTTYFQEMLLDVAPDSTLNTPHNPFIKDSLAYISYYEDGIHIYDMSDPTHPTLHAFLDTYTDNTDGYNGYAGCWGMYPFMPSGNLFASDMKYGLYSFQLASPTATKEPEPPLFSFALSPNPAHDMLRIHLQPTFDSTVQGQMYNSTGEVCRTFVLNNETTTLDIRDLPGGMYFIKIQSGNMFFCEKVLVE